MTYACNILADSVNPVGHRLTTFEITFPRFILAELNTHRMLSRNSASSRAIPTEKQIAKVEEAPFVPVFNARVKGMGVGEPLSPHEQEQAQHEWLIAARYALTAAARLLHVDKSRANRLLEPFMWHTAIVSATEWDNFYALRDHEAAQPEFRTIAHMMREAQKLNIPKQLGWGGWHLPLVFWEDENQVTNSLLPSVSAGRCARVSYDRQHDDDPAPNACERWSNLSSVGHWSPGEHPARSITHAEHAYILHMQQEERRAAESVGIEPDLDQHEFFGNFRGFVQLRKHYDGEAVFGA